MRSSQWRSVLVVLLGWLGNLGCGEGSSQVPQGPPTYFYGGTIQVGKRADGSPISRTVVGRRVFDESASQIIDEWVSATAPEELVRAVYKDVRTLVVTGSTVQDSAKGITGELTGEPWKWTEWYLREDYRGHLSEEKSTIHPTNIVISYKNAKTGLFDYKSYFSSISEADYTRQLSSWKVK
jgi:hypothetical protein